ncbi:hypothetical protein ANN_02369 [Periplaneta americana]|uniref:Uncharacterized protein n=1 Tax=Periplaneta americana TaxID=6978 RepID=A0ABQ8TZJ7_PERAM|nr:hypothetical protein ANN_02369 [Periplaneta americana]
MNPGSNTESYPAFARIGLRENPGKNLNLPRPGFEPGPPGFAARRVDRYSTGMDPDTFVWSCVTLTQYITDVKEPALRALKNPHNTSCCIRNIKSRLLRWAGQVARIVESRNAYRVLVGRPEGKRPLGRPRRRWEDNIKMDLREVGYDDREWINLAQDRDRWLAYVRAAMNLRVP